MDEEFQRTSKGIPGFVWALLAAPLALFLCIGLAGLGVGFWLVQDRALPDLTIDVSDSTAPTAPTPAPILLKSFEYLPEQIDCIALSTDGKSLAAGCRDGTVKTWDVASRQELATLTYPEEEVHTVAFSPDGKTLASGTRGQIVRIWKVVEGEEQVIRNERKDLIGSFIHAVAFLPDGKSLLTANYNGYVRLWDVETGKERIQFLTFFQLEAMVPAPDGSFVAVGGGSQFDAPPAPRVKLYDLSTGKPRKTVLHHVEDVRTLAFTKDGKLLAGGGGKIGEAPPIVNLWEVATGQKKASFKGHTDLVRALAFSPDDKLLASGGWDRTVRLWDVGSGREIAQIKHPASVLGVLFGPDGKTLFTGGWHNSIQMWDLAPVLQAAGR